MGNSLFTPEEIKMIVMEFCSEAKERLDLSESYLLNPDILSNAEQLKDLKRVLHGLKGSSVAAGLKDFGVLIHDMESRLLAGPLDKSMVDQMLADIDILRAIIVEAEERPV